MKINMKTTLAFLLIVGMGRFSNSNCKTDENVFFKCTMAERFKIQNFWRVFNNQFLVPGNREAVNYVAYIMNRTLDKLHKKGLVRKNVKLTYDDVRSAYDEAMREDVEHFFLSERAHRVAQNEQNRDNAIATYLWYHKNNIEFPEWDDEVIPSLQKMRKAFLKSRRDWKSEK